MSIIVFLFYILITIYIIRYFLKFAKTFNENNKDILSNMQKMSNDINTKVRTEYTNNSRAQSDISLDDYIKLNINPIKEKSSKRSRM